MSKVILVLVDGLGFATAVREMGYLEGLVAQGFAKRWGMRSVLPSLSRPAYESVLTGVTPAVHGITSNKVNRLSRVPGVFGEARAAGKVTAAAAYSWISELYNGPFDPVLDREVVDGPGAIQHGRFYVLDPFPDQELYWQADLLVRRHQPDFLLIHPMGCDHMGHEHGGESLEYRRAAAESDDALAQLIPSWREAGYRVLVTADHGMCKDGHHGGTDAVVRRVPFYMIDAETGGIAPDEADQLSVAPTVLSLLGVQPPKTMTAPILS
ncbi:alkaline phosphatase family protein [Rhodospirillum sp. A1_3_36]|uniref:alkaline phosphatase family protein n=1 Tax=Rhodospirillum sp. A1_3_36 TaxID=3391666 RepID=UPI0039A6AA2D